ncbi:MAG: GldG family protein [Chromatiaceae bacterium]|nr:GldG family protein [Chromatiaceae bacterium]MCP5408075.1 GldG family protein [Chromatiaceae bacterium]MCP5442974.1 GldG family protein [Chromatiaceae bacterium]
MRSASGFKQRLQIILFYLLLTAAAAMLSWLSQRHVLIWDWSDNARNSLSDTSKTLLDRLDSTLKITCFAPHNSQLRLQISEFINRYQRHSSNIDLEFIDPAQHPALIRELGIRVTGELRLEYAGRSENLSTIDEQSISNAIQRLLQQGERWILVVEGHGERRLDRQANHDLGLFGSELMQKGYRIQPVDLGLQKGIADNTSLLILAGPQTGYLPRETELIVQYVERGGNLLWLLEPDAMPETLQPLAGLFRLKLFPGTIVDASGAGLGLDDPALALVAGYPDHPVTRQMESLTLYPHAAALASEASAGWQITPLLQTQAQSWNEIGPISGEIKRDPESGEKPGPLDIGLAFSRQLQQREQRVAIIGDGDFLSNTYLGNGGNLNLGLSLIRWLTRDDSLIDIPARSAGDTQLNLTPVTGILIALTFLVLLPLLFAVTGLVIWWHRRKL